MISQGMMKVEDLLRVDEDLAHKVGMIERELTRNRKNTVLLMSQFPEFVGILSARRVFICSLFP